MTIQKEEAKRNIIGKLKRHFGRSIEDATLDQVYKATAMCVRDEMMEKWIDANAERERRGLKQLYYMSAEFLMGRALTNNMINLGAYRTYTEALAELGFDIGEIEEQESDAGLGNGGLGRLAACFLDSLSTLDLPVTGCGIRYEYGLFRQRILDGEQVEVPDNWTERGYVWEVERQDERYEVRFDGEIEEIWTDAGMKVVHRNYHTVYAVPYDMPISGYQSKMPATLRLWSARAASRLDLNYFNRGDYIHAMAEKELSEVISKVLYPENNHEQGKQLRLKQFYFLASATVQSIVRQHKEKYGDLHTLPDKVTVQINDTHPTLAIPELMRILMDEEGFGWDEAFDIAGRVFNYTNHTIMTEALECWSEPMFRSLLPRIHKIISTINDRFCEQMWQVFPGDWERISQMSIIAYSEIRMANLCIAVCGKVNGVSRLHGNILRTKTFRDFYVAFPDKFLGITNGITQRRWLAEANPGLTALIRDAIGDGFIRDYRQLEQLLPFADDAAFRERFAVVKAENKRRFANFLLRTQDVRIDPDSIFDIQAKRLHEYKRQLLKVVHILRLYNGILQGEPFDGPPCTFIFAAKAAPGYAKAKNIIKLINSVGQLVNREPLCQGKIAVVFVENYSVSTAERMIPAANISEQLSTAGREASGTGNMKFMMNGAVTLGTMDGANVEIHEQVGDDNMFIFGARVEEIHHMEEFHTYRAGAYFEKDPALRDALTRLIDGSLPVTNDRQFSDIYQSLLFGEYGHADEYYVLYDFASYSTAFQTARRAYGDAAAWNRMAVVNTAKSGFFSADRTVEEYNRLIWHLLPLD